MIKEISNNMNAKSHRPGWQEVLVCFITYVILVVAGIEIIKRVVPSGTVMQGLSFSALSALAGAGAFLAAYMLRIRSNVAFGLCRTSVRWILIGVGYGVAVFIAAKIFMILFVAMGGTMTNIQQPYQTAATGGTLSFIVQMLFIAVATPIGEELAFRGVLTSALIHTRPIVCILVSSLVFAFAHGLNEIFIAAFITGLATSYLFYRTKSIWPGVVVHMVNNALGTILSVIIASMI